MRAGMRIFQLVFAPAFLTACLREASATVTQTSGVEISNASAHSPNLSIPPDFASSPAYRYGQLDQASCERELAARGVNFSRVEPSEQTRGILAPIRIHGPIRGVSYHTGLREKDRARSPYEILDCRLGLALDDFSQILASHDIVEVVHYSMYRPPSPRGVNAEGLGTRHSGALAIDAGSFTKRDGTKIIVERDFHGGIGQKACGVALPSEQLPRELREIVCEAAEKHLFNVALTPDYNWQHRNHFHLEVTPNVKWFIVH